jgi:hypothetical protein
MAAGVTLLVCSMVIVAQTSLHAVALTNLVLMVTIAVAIA